MVIGNIIIACGCSNTINGALAYCWIDGTIKNSPGYPYTETLKGRYCYAAVMTGFNISATIVDSIVLFTFIHHWEQRHSSSLKPSSHLETDDAAYPPPYKVAVSEPKKKIYSNPLFRTFVVLLLLIIHVAGPFIAANIVSHT